jgi:hypothetical protein
MVSADDVTGFFLPRRLYRGQPAWSSPWYHVGLLLASIAFNFGVGLGLRRKGLTKKVLLAGPRCTIR